MNRQVDFLFFAAYAASSWNSPLKSLALKQIRAGICMQSVFLPVITTEGGTLMTKRYEELTFADDFMFCRVLEDSRALSGAPVPDSGQAGRRTGIRKSAEAHRNQSRQQRCPV